MMTAESMKAFGLGIRDYYEGDRTAAVRIVREDGMVSDLAIGSFFRQPTDLQMDRVALDSCRGRVLDVGAGVGIHSLYLQEKGFDICAMDVSPEACEVMKKRGLKNVRCCSFIDLEAGEFDTLLILGRSICMAETLAGLDNFLVRACRMVNPGGQIILNSVDVTATSDPQHLAYHKIVRQAGRYVGEMLISMEYRGVCCPATGLLHVDEATLADHAEASGWSYDMLFKDVEGGYLARLVKKDKL